LRVKELSLAFAEEGKARFVNRTRADRPSMTDVHLLNALIGEIAKTRKICSAGLETRESFARSAA